MKNLLGRTGTRRLWAANDPVFPLVPRPGPGGLDPDQFLVPPPDAGRNLRIGFALRVNVGIPVTSATQILPDPVHATRTLRRVPEAALPGGQRRNFKKRRYFTSHGRPAIFGMEMPVRALFHYLRCLIRGHRWVDSHSLPGMMTCIRCRRRKQA